MRKALCFYWLCVRRALSGSVEKANAWSTVLGAAIIWIVLWFFGYRLALPETLGQTIAFTILCIFAAWLVLFIFRFLRAPPALYWEADEKMKVLATRLAPNIKVFLNEKTGGVSLLTINPPQKWVQITVQSASAAPLIDCEVWINKIQRVNEGDVVDELIYEPIMALWSQAPPPESRRRDIPAMVPQAANFFSLADVPTPQLTLQFDHVKTRLFDEIQKPGQYRIETVVSAKECSPVRKFFLFEWSGKFENVKISESPEAHSR